MQLDAAAPAQDRALDEHLLAAGLAIACRGDALTCIALPVPVVAAPALVAAWRSSPLVTWTAGTTSLVGIGVARELRGRGAARCEQVIAAARALRVETIVPGFALGDRAWRPKLFGGLAFVPGAADRAPWTGFGDAWFALPRWTYSNDGWLVLAVDASDARHPERWHDELGAFRVALGGFAQRPQPALTRIDPGDAEAWRANVRAITAAIARGECAKVVAARRALVTLAGEARPADLLAELDARHAECARIVVRPPNAATLVAATPERLVRLDGTRVACDALAGSQPRAGDDRATLFASMKDRREHALVVDAIASVLADLGARVEAPREPGIRTLRHVLHLHTPIAATLATRRHILELAAALHPTPAVGGTPTRVATEWIAAHEPEPRGWYASPVGWFDLDGNGELAIAIRSGLLAGDTAHLWAGAGIVAGSDPDRELAETDLKLRAMLGALGVAA